MAERVGLDPVPAVLDIHGPGTLVTRLREIAGEEPSV